MKASRNSFAKGWEQIFNKTFAKMVDWPGYDAELTYRKKAADGGCGKSEWILHVWNMQ